MALTDNDVIVRDNSVAVHNVAGHMPRCSYTLTPGGHSAYGESNDEERKETVNHQGLPLITIS